MVDVFWDADTLVRSAEAAGAGLGDDVGGDEDGIEGLFVAGDDWRGDGGDGVRYVSGEV